MSTCRFVASDEPRILPGRHNEDCPGGEACAGCQPCPGPHCRVCGRAHSADTCAECRAEARDDLLAIASACDALPEEAVNQGVESEAMVLLGPAADPEAWGHLSASVKVGRIPADYLSAADNELHPLLVLGTWEMIWREHLEQPTALEATIPRLVDYLNRQLHVMAAEPLVPFEDFARDLRRCRTHVEAVLHDSNMGDRANVGCFECRGGLERRLTPQGFEDVWTCKVCRRRYTYAEYNFALRAALEGESA